MLKPKTRWKLNETDDNKITNLVKTKDVSNLLAKLLVNRGINNIEEAEAFLNKETQSFFDPFLIMDMDVAINRVNLAINQNEKILVFGDYDADGVTSTTVMISALKQKNADVDFYIPNRFTEGYGPNEKAFRWAKEAGYSLIITVDTGISAVHEAKVAKDIGLDLIITDHHEIPEVMPDALAIIHPRKPGSLYPFGELAGVGVAFKFAHALLGEVPQELLQFAAIGTVADLVPLQSENRLIVFRGIQQLRRTTNLGLQHLFSVCGIESSNITEETIGFTIGPRINAAGRLESADPAVKLLLTREEEEAEMLATEINELNKERQAIVNEITKEAIEEVEVNFPPEENSVLVIAKEGWNAGVIGIVASRLVEKFYRPTIVLSIDSEKGQAKGSARSIIGFDLYKNLSDCRELLPHFGGHPMAAGMTLKVEDITELRERLNRQASEQLSEEDFRPITNVELLCDITDVTLETIEEMENLSPFGVGNPKPLVMLKEVSFSQMRRIGSDGNHLKITLNQDNKTLDSIGFGKGDICDVVSPVSKMSLVGELSINEWNGFRKPQIMIQDVAVDNWQLFDLRGSKNIEKHLKTISGEFSVVAFQRKTLSTLNLDFGNMEVVCVEDGEHNVKNNILVLLDLPHDKSEMENIIKQNFPERIYCFFTHEEEHFFSTIPKREHFKWYYAFLLKQKQVNIKKYASVIAERKGWSKETIEFMSQVFFELEFVTIENGVIKLVEKPVKRDITDSNLYTKKQQQIEMEHEFLYSSYEMLRQWFEGVRKGSLELEEEVR